MEKYIFVSSILFTLFIIFKKVSWLISNNQYSSSNKNLPPSPPKLPIIGNLHQLSFHFRSLKSLAEKYGPIVLIQLGTRTGLIISSAEAAEEVLRKHDLSFAERPRVEYAGRFGYGFRDLVFAPYGEYWRQARGICVSQLLSNKRVSSFRSVREEEIAKTVETIKESCSSICDMSQVFATLSFDVFCRSALGKNNSEEKNGRWFKALVDEASSLAALANVSDVIPWLGWVNHVNGREARAKRLFKEVDGYLEDFIEKTIQRSRERDDNHDQDGGHKSFVDVLLGYERLDSDSTGFTLDRASVKALILNMVFGGTDPTHSLLEWTFSELIKNPHVMSKLQKEIRDINGGAEMIGEEDSGKLPYLKAVIREALRMHPPFEYHYREARDAVRIQTYDVAPGTIVFIDAGLIGRDPRMWEEPGEFRPERFLVKDIPADIKGQHFHYLPFGSGRRICPGSGAAMAIVELAIANLIRNFDFTLPDGAKPEDLDMTETFSVTSTRKVPLLLVPSCS